MKKKISITINEKTYSRIESIIDNLLIRNVSQAIEYLVDKALGEEKEAVILFGGDENSLKISDKEYRITAKIGKLTVVEMAINKLRENGFKKIYIIARPSPLTAVFDILKDGSAYGVNITYLEEKSSHGSAESLKLLKGKIKNTFLVVFGDLIFKKINIEELWNDHLRNHVLSTIILTTSPTPTRKGIVKIEGNRILEFTQKPKKSDVYLGFSSIFIAEPELLEYPGNSFELDIFPDLAAKGLLNGHLSSEKEVHIHTASDVKSYLNK